MRLLLLAAALALAGSGCVTLTAAENVEFPRGEFAGIEQAWLEPGRLVVHVSRGQDERSLLALNPSFRSEWPGWTLTYPLEPGSEPLELDEARGLNLLEPIEDTPPASPWPRPLPPGAVPVEVLDAGPYGFKGEVLLDGRPRRSAPLRPHDGRATPALGPGAAGRRRRPGPRPRLRAGRDPVRGLPHLLLMGTAGGSAACTLIPEALPCAA